VTASHFFWPAGRASRTLARNVLACSIPPSRRRCPRGRQRTHRLHSRHDKRVARSPEGHRRLTAEWRALRNHSAGVSFCGAGGLSAGFAFRRKAARSMPGESVEVE
jgi:hypothetical protein